MDELIAACRRHTRAIEAAAEAAHDRHYEIGPSMSDLGYAFADERTKQSWRELVLDVLRTFGEHAK